MSYFGGDPRMPEGISWPQWRNRNLGFIARISLRDLHRALPIAWLPNEGALLFFYDVEEQPWGFDPTDKGGARVLLVPELAEAVSPGADDTSACAFPRLNVEPRQIRSLRSIYRNEIEEFMLTDDEEETYNHLIESSFHENPKHQISGFPIPQQDDSMELESELVSNGIYCGEGYVDPRVDSHRPKAVDWRLLLQVDCDHQLGAMWGDMGMLYYWIREQDAVARQFDKAWLVLQCG